MDRQETDAPGYGDSEALREVFADPTRRAVIEAVSAADGPVTEAEIVDRLLARRGGPREHLAVALHHNHFPALADVGLIAGGDGERVRLTEAGERAATVSRLVEEGSRWGRTGLRD